MKASNASKVIGVVVTIVLLIIVKVSWRVIRNGMKSNDSKPPWRGVNLTNDAVLLPAELSTTELSRNSTKFFVVLDSYKIFARPYFATNETLTEIKITDSPEFSSNFTKEVYNNGFTSDCSNKKMYILKTASLLEASEQVLDVIQYDDNYKFRRIKRVPNMLDGAVSIASDWTTGNLYWIEYIQSVGFSIKVTNKSFDKPEYVVQPTKKEMSDIQVYPKNNEIFFIQDSSIWYTSTSRNSTPKLLLPDINHVKNLVIDYELDKLCFFLFSTNLCCGDIGNFTRPINGVFIYPGHSIAVNFAVANNAFYTIAKTKLFLKSLFYGKNVTDTSNGIARVKGEDKIILSFFSLNCSYESNVNKSFETTTIFASNKTEALRIILANEQ